MKKLHEFDQAAVHRLIETEAWDQPLAEVSRIRLSVRQQAVFWGLRIYVMVMTAVVAWAFAHGVKA